MSQTRFYQIWADLLRRCDHKLRHNYPLYGGRGIRYDLRWKNFVNFYNDMYQGYLKHSQKYGEKNTGIERVNNNGHLEKKRR